MGVRPSIFAGLVMLTASMAAMLISILYLSNVLAFYHVFYPYVYVGYLNIAASFLALISGILMFCRKHFFSILTGIVVSLCGVVSSLIFVYFGHPWENDPYVGIPLVILSTCAIFITVFDYATKKSQQK